MLLYQLIISALLQLASAAHSKISSAVSLWIIVYTFNLSSNIVPEKLALLK